MRNTFMKIILPGITTALAAVSIQSMADELPLPSWNDGNNRQALLEFVEVVTTPESPDFVKTSKRIAVFDNDGTLWAEKPLYSQFFYVVDRVREMANEHPEWRDAEPFASILRGDLEAALAGGTNPVLELLMTTHAGMTAGEFGAAVADWFETARHPVSKKPYRAMVYKPMLELIDFLHENNFKVFIVSGGGRDFVRVISESYYGIVPERVIGSSVKSGYELRDGKPVIVKLPEVDLINDKAGKPVGINRYIGQRPILAIGNSDGDFEMLEYTTAGAGRRMGMLLHHDDAEREWAYDRVSHVGKLERGLDEGPRRGWKIISMKNDWKQVFSSDL
jgi:phosphoglycolate phosphatase-like HAD superfamily hydrolase